MGYYKCGQIYVTPYSNTGIYTASGAIANFTTSVVKPLINLTAYIEAIQEAGTPTPQSPKAISGWSALNLTECGSNIFNEDFEQGTYNISTGNKTNDPYRIRSVDYICVKPNTTYRFVTPTSILVYYYDADKTFISYDSGNNSINLTTPNNCYYLTIAVGYSGYPLTPSTYGHDVSINYPSTDTTYHAYNGNTTTIQLGQTVYGGYVEQDKEGHRRLVITHGSFTIDKNITNISWYDDFKQAAFSNILANAPAKYIYNEATYKCDKLKAVPNNGRTSNVGNYISLIESGLGIACSIPDCDTLGKVTSFLQNNSIFFVYELATPITIDLPDGTPINTLSGVNNVYNDSGNTTVQYTKPAYS